MDYLRPQITKSREDLGFQISDLISNSLLERRKLGDYRFGRTQAVYGGAHDSPRIARPFAHRVQTSHRQRLVCPLITHNPYWRTATRFRAYQCRIAQK